MMTPLEFIKEKHNGEIPYYFGKTECAKMMETYSEYINGETELVKKMEAILFAAEYAYSLANLKEEEKKVTEFKSPPSMIYEQFECAYDRWAEQKAKK